MGNDRDKETEQRVVQAFRYVFYLLLLSTNI
jgi:hypothetical protein